MLGTTRPVEVEVVATLGSNPRYAGSIHDSAAAQRFGYRAALVPGAFIYGYMSRLAVASWGHDWLARGTIQSHSRRPVFDSERLRLSATRLVDDGQELRAAIVVRNDAGEEVATGAVGLPHEAPAPLNLAAFPILPVAENPPLVQAGDLPSGAPLTSANDIMMEETHDISLRDFGEIWPGYRDERIVHPGLLLRLTLRDAIDSFRYPTPTIYVEASARHYGIARVGEQLGTSGRITEVSERKGNHYFATEQVLIAGGARVIAHFRRRSIYAARQQEAA